MPEEKKKNIFTNIANAFTDKDEKEAAAAEAAKKAAAEAAAQKAVAAKAAADKAAADKLAAEKLKAEQDKAALEAKVKHLEDEARKAEAKKAMDDATAKAEAANKANRERLAAMAAEAAKTKFIAEHKIGEDETLSHVALKHYGSANRAFWMLIYEANKDIIGDNPGIVIPGTVIKIPELPQELKDQLK